MRVNWKILKAPPIILGVFFFFGLLSSTGRYVTAKDDLGLRLEKGQAQVFLYPVFELQRYPTLNPWFELLPDGIFKSSEVQANLGFGLHIQPKGNISYSIEQSLGSRFSIFGGDPFINSQFNIEQYDGSSDVFLHSLKGTLRFQF